MSPVPAEALCRTCSQPLFHTRSFSGWVHVEHPSYRHAAVPMSPNERDDHEAEQRALLAKIAPYMQPRPAQGPTQ